MAVITVAAIRQKLADSPHREDWHPIRRMTDEEIEKAIAAGFSWIASMENPYDPQAPFDLADVADAEMEAFANSLGLPPDGKPSA